MIHDDFGVAAVGLKYGAWDGLAHYYNRWTSAYSTIFLRLSFAEHAVALPPLLTTVVIAIGLLGLYWLLRYMFAQFRLEGPRGIFALAASCLVLAAAINAFYTPESFYWYSASMQYTVPLVCLIACLALAGWTINGAGSRRRLTLGTIACGLISFVTAGASEMFLVFQLVFLFWLAALAIAVLDRRVRRAFAVVAGLMLFATAIGLIVQLNSPGIWNRMESDAVNYRPPIRSISQLALLTIQITFESIGRQEVIAGFALLAGLGLFLGMQTTLPAASIAGDYAADGFPRAAALGLAIQIVFLPILWAQQSDNPQFFGRFSLSFMVVICLNLALTLVFLLAFWQRHRFKFLLSDKERGPTAVSGLLLLVFVLLVTMTQVRVIDGRASTYLYVTALGMLLMLAILWRARHSDRLGRSLGLAALGILVAGWVTIAALVCATFIGHGFSSHRMMAGPAFLQVSAGLLWGLHLGLTIKTSAILYANRRRWERLLMSGGLACALVIGAGMFLGQARLIPDFQIYARDWDARHADILLQRDNGQTHIEVAQLEFDLADYIGMGTLRSAEHYYGVESIQIVGP